MARESHVRLISIIRILHHVDAALVLCDQRVDLTHLTLYPPEHVERITPRITFLCLVVLGIGSQAFLLVLGESFFVVATKRCIVNLGTATDFGSTEHVIDALPDKITLAYLVISKLHVVVQISIAVLQ